MKEHRGYRTIDQDWSRFYREFPEIYDRFSTHSKTLVNIICDKFGLDGKNILELGCGTGIATMELVKRAGSVIAMDIQEEMIEHSKKKARQNNISNVSFVQGNTRELPVLTGSVDAVIGIYAGIYDKEAVRVVKDGGIIIQGGNHYRWYAGELCPIINAPSGISEYDYNGQKEMRKRGYSFTDVWAKFNYASVQEALETFGFIFGPKAIDYLLEHRKRSIRQKARILYKEVVKRH